MKSLRLNQNSKAAGQKNKTKLKDAKKAFESYNELQRDFILLVWSIVDIKNVITAALNLLLNNTNKTKSLAFLLDK